MMMSTASVGLVCVAHWYAYHQHDTHTHHAHMVGLVWLPVVARDAGNRTGIGGVAGVWELIVGVLRRHADNGVAVNNACFALWSLSADNAGAW